MVDVIEKKEWDFLNSIHAFSKKYIKYDFRKSRGEPISEAYTGRLLEMYMASIYKAVKDKKISTAIGIALGEASPEEINLAMYQWLEINCYDLDTKLTEDGLRLIYRDLFGEGPLWHPVPIAFKEIWEIHCTQHDESLEFYMGDFIEGAYRPADM